MKKLFKPILSVLASMTFLAYFSSFEEKPIKVMHEENPELQSMYKMIDSVQNKIDSVYVQKHLR